MSEVTTVHTLTANDKELLAQLLAHRIANDKAGIIKLTGKQERWHKSAMNALQDHMDASLVLFNRFTTATPKWAEVLLSGALRREKITDPEQVAAEMIAGCVR